MKKKSPKKKEKVEPKNNKKIPVTMELPVDSLAMEEYVDKNREVINDMLVDQFDFAVRKNYGGVEVFCFKDSNYVVVVNRKDFRENLQNIFDYSLKNQNFNTCAKSKKVIDLIDKFSFVMNYKKIKPT